MTGVILVVGDVVDDIGVRPLGQVNAASDTVSEIRLTPGGSAANVAAWIAHLGTRVRFVGRVGADALDRHIAALPGVDARLSGDPNLPTATIVLTLDDKADRTMYVDRAANSTLTLADLPESVWEDVTWLHLTGYTFFDPLTRPIAETLIDHARARGVGISIDPSSWAFLEAAGHEQVMSWFTHADLLFPNEDEQRLLAIEADRAVVSMGASGSTFGEYVSAALPADVIDTTGAGDAFCAGFLATWVDNRDPDAALAAGAVAAAECVSLRGARPPRR